VFVAYLRVLLPRKPTELDCVQPPEIAKNVVEILTVKCLCLFRTSLGHPQGGQREAHPIGFDVEGQPSTRTHQMDL